MSRLVEVTANSFGEDLSKLSGKQLAELSKAIQKAEAKGGNNMTKETKERLQGVKESINDALGADNKKIDEFKSQGGNSSVVTEKEAAQKAAREEETAKQQKKSDIGKKLDAKVKELEGKNGKDLVSIANTLDIGKIKSEIMQELNLTDPGQIKFDNTEHLNVTREVIAKHSVKAELKAEKVEEQKREANSLTEEQKTQKKEARTKTAIDEIASAFSGLTVSDAKGGAKATAQQNPELTPEAGKGQGVSSSK
jgi:hypothetical protein